MEGAEIIEPSLINKSVRRITPKIHPLTIPNLWNWRYLIFLFIRRDFVVYYQQTILGPLWYIITPLISTIVLTVIFGNIAKLPTDDIPHFIFYFTGSLAWGYFSDCFSRVSQSLSQNTREFGNAPFPRLTVPIASVVSASLQFGIQSICFVCIYAWYITKGELNPGNLLLVLPAIAQLIITALGAGLFVAAITSKYRDFTHLAGLALQMLYLCTPVVYPLSMVESPWRIVYRFNPLSSVVELFRKAFFNVADLSMIEYATGWMVSCMIFICGLVIFNLVEKTYVDTV